MKSVLIPLIFAIGSAMAFGQGTVIFNNRVIDSVVTHVYLPLPSDPGFVQVGNGPSDFPAGTTDWSGWTPVSGDGFSAQLFAAPGANAPVDSLAPAFPITTFRSDSFAGFVNGVTATLPGVPVGTPIATIQMRVWDNHGGLLTDWAAAVAQPPGIELIGMSSPINVAGVSSPTGGQPTLDGLQSFNLTLNVPEPSPIWITSAGLLLGLIWLWKKQSAPALTRHKTNAKEYKPDGGSTTMAQLRNGRYHVTGRRLRNDGDRK